MRNISPFVIFAAVKSPTEDEHTPVQTNARRKDSSGNITPSVKPPLEVAGGTVLKVRHYHGTIGHVRNAAGSNMMAKALTLF